MAIKVCSLKSKRGSQTHELRFQALFHVYWREKNWETYKILSDFKKNYLMLYVIYFLLSILSYFWIYLFICIISHYVILCIISNILITVSSIEIKIHVLEYQYEFNLSQFIHACAYAQKQTRGFFILHIFLKNKKVIYFFPKIGKNPVHEHFF